MDPKTLTQMLLLPFLKEDGELKMQLELQAGTVRVGSDGTPIVSTQGEGRTGCGNFLFPLKNHPKPLLGVRGFSKVAQQTALVGRGGGGGESPKLAATPPVS